MKRATDNETKIAIAFNVNSILKQRGRTRYWLAKEIDEYHSTIANVCHGRYVCGSGLLTRIANALGVTANDILKPVKKIRTSA